MSNKSKCDKLEDRRPFDVRFRIVPEGDFYLPLRAVPFCSCTLDAATLARMFADPERFADAFGGTPFMPRRAQAGDNVKTMTPNRQWDQIAEGLDGSQSLDQIRRLPLGLVVRASEAEAQSYFLLEKLSPGDSRPAWWDDPLLSTREKAVVIEGLFAYYSTSGKTPVTSARADWLSERDSDLQSIANEIAAAWVGEDTKFGKKKLADEVWSQLRFDRRYKNLTVESITRRIRMPHLPS